MTRYAGRISARRSARWKRVAGLFFSFPPTGAEEQPRLDGTHAAKKAQRAKHTSDPIFPAPGTLLSTALPSGSRYST